MKFRVKKSSLKGTISIPPSKSHTIRALIIAALANGKSVIHNPLISEDTKACAGGLAQLGAKISLTDTWTVEGFNGRPRLTDKPIDVKNSGTTLRMLASVAALGDSEVVLTGDDSIKTRPMNSLLKALRVLGAETAVSNDSNGSAPVTIRGRMRGGIAEVEGMTSQFISSLLLVAPLLKNNCELKAVRLNERPYMDMTLQWLTKMGIEYNKKGRNGFVFKGGQTYYPFEKAMPSDFSSATFPLIAALITEDSDIEIKGLDMNDSQGDKKILNIVKEMGAEIEIGSPVKVKSSSFDGYTIDLNDVPDSLPAFAVLGCFSKGETHLINVPQARIKETDRIKVMCEELTKMGADIQETEKGLVIKESELKGAELNGHGDHRVVMALTLAGLGAEGETTISTAESVDMTFPGFKEKMVALGADIK